MEIFDPPKQHLVKDPGFIPDLEELNNLWGKYTASKTYDSITNQMLAVEQYETTFGIQTASPKLSPVALVCMSDSTDYLHNSVLERTIHHLTKLKVHAATGMSIDELLDKPTWWLQMTVAGVVKAGMADAAKMADLDNELKDK